MDKILKNTRCPCCEQGIEYGPRGGRGGYWLRSVSWVIQDGRYGGCCDCGACFAGKHNYNKQRKLGDKKMKGGNLGG